MCLCTAAAASTFVAGRLAPQDAGDVGGPGVLGVGRGSLQDKGLVLGGSPPEPDLEAEPVVPAGLRQAHVRCLTEDGVQSEPELTGSPSERGAAHLEGVLVDEDVQPTLHLLGLAEQKQILEQEDVALAFPPAAPDRELVLPDQLTLLLQVHLQGEQNQLTRGSALPSTGGNNSQQDC